MDERCFAEKGHVDGHLDQVVKGFVGYHYINKITKVSTLKVRKYSKEF